MCGLCSPDTEEQAAERKITIYRAEQMEKMAKSYREMASGKIHPHSEEAAKIGRTARLLIKELVSEWL